MSITQIIIQGIQDAGGALSTAGIDKLALKTFKNQNNKRRSVDVELAALVERGELRVGSDGMYRVPKTRKQLMEVVHIGITFYSTPTILAGAEWTERHTTQSRIHRCHE